MATCQPPCLTENNNSNELKICLDNNRKEKDFDGYLINFKPFKSSSQPISYEISIQNQSVLKLIDDLFQTYNNFSDCSSLNLEQENINGPFSFAPLPKQIVESYKLKNAYSRVAILDQLAKHNLSKYLHS
jgi:hypothetical protein